MEQKTGTTPVVTRSQGERPRQTQRIPFGVPQTRLGVDVQIPGYKLYWTNDEGGAIERAQAGGYQFVTPAEIGGSSKESQEKRLVGIHKDGSPMYAYLMKIEQEFWDEDQAALQRIQDQFDHDIQRGSLEAVPGDNRYSDIKVT